MAEAPRPATENQWDCIPKSKLTVSDWFEAYHESISTETEDQRRCTATFFQQLAKDFPKLKTGEAIEAVKEKTSKKYTQFVESRDPCTSSTHWAQAVLKQLTEYMVFQQDIESLSCVIETQTLLDMTDWDFKDIGQKIARLRGKMVAIWENYVGPGAPYRINAADRASALFAPLTTVLDPLDKGKWFPLGAEGDGRLMRRLDESKLKDALSAFKGLKRYLFARGEPTARNFRAIRIKDAFMTIFENNKCEGATARFGYYNNLNYDSAEHYENKLDGEHYVDDSHSYRLPLVRDHTGNVIDVPGSGSSLLIGGVVGASAVVIIMLIFCLGLAFGMIIYWGYSQKRALDVKRQKEEMRWIGDENRNV
eukprot:953855_1